MTSVGCSAICKALSRSSSTWCSQQLGRWASPRREKKNELLVVTEQPKVLSAGEWEGWDPGILCYVFSCTKSHCPMGQAHFWQINSHLKSHLSRVRRRVSVGTESNGVHCEDTCAFDPLYILHHWSLVLNGWSPTRSISTPGNRLERHPPPPPDWLSQANPGLLGPRGLVLINPPGYSDAHENLRAIGLPSEMAEDQ